MPPKNGMRILRDLRLSTKVLILYEMVRDPDKGQRALAEALDVTPQAISDYLKHMEAEGLVEREGRASRPTVLGFQFLQDHLRELGDFTYQAMRELNVINSCAAIASEDLEEGQSVVLELADGVIRARAGEEGDSTGVAMHAARAGEDLAVGSLVGILGITPGTITVAALPSAAEGGTRSVDVEALLERVNELDPDVVAALDPVGLVAARRLDMEVDVRFAVEQGALDAALRGQDVLVLGGRDSVGTVIELVVAHNVRSDQRVDYTLMDASKG